MPSKTPAAVIDRAFWHGRRVAIAAVIAWYGSSRRGEDVRRVTLDQIAAFEGLSGRQHQPAQAVSEPLHPARPVTELDRAGRLAYGGMEEDRQRARDR